MSIILDCDIASTFAKIDRIALLKKIFPKSDICITSSVYIELLRARRIGFSFPDKIFELDILRDIEVKDNTIIKGKEEILEIFDAEDK
ncbi:hypothetical protein ANME2D_01621 [Candidatus Methanoperedens nitroreducens]|uniref:PIN domain-containing protein n=1 Tax=Candidatus Methanoperedens nitratireducens TaxID=1392998 RepID=A0A062V4D8_9EURY|nr:hypothetical protein [Candidatus Methanoperedens nitroreducens]KCZ72217.1 hypothetical protein ANME2D_01621 [Candidatus Methanoperedens nitroreducens]MDJ1421805.1 hypothetical protein [Candidatus Methanoperedens sp.]